MVQKFPISARKSYEDWFYFLSVTSSEGLPWAAQALAGRRRGGGEASAPNALIVPSQREELLHAAQGGSFAWPSLQHRVCDKHRAETPSDGARPFSALHTAVTATAWKSKDFLGVGWLCKEGTWGPTQGFWRASAHLLHCCRALRQPRFARNKRWGASGLIKPSEAARVVGITEAARNSCNYRGSTFCRPGCGHQLFGAGCFWVAEGGLGRLTLPTCYLTSPRNITASS